MLEKTKGRAFETATAPSLVGKAGEAGPQIGERSRK